MRKPAIGIGEDKDADQLCSDCTADQRLCLRAIYSAISLLLKSEICVGPGRNPKLLVFSRTCSYKNHGDIFFFFFVLVVESWIKSVQPGMTRNCHFLLLLLLLLFFYITHLKAIVLSDKYKYKA